MAVGIAAEVRALLRMRMGRRPRAEVLAWASPLVDAYFEGLASADYAVASAGFSDRLRQSFPEDEFFSQRRTVVEAVGPYHSHAIQAVQRHVTLLQPQRRPGFLPERHGITGAGEPAGRRLGEQVGPQPE